MKASLMNFPTVTFHLILAIAGILYFSLNCVMNFIFFRHFQSRVWIQALPYLHYQYHHHLPDDPGQLADLDLPLLGRQPLRSVRAGDNISIVSIPETKSAEPRGSPGLAGLGHCGVPQHHPPVLSRSLLHPGQHRLPGHQVGPTVLQRFFISIFRPKLQTISSEVESVPLQHIART